MPQFSRPATTALLLIGVLVGVMAVALPAAAAELPFDTEPAVTISGSGSVAVDAVMPGDALAPQRITIDATGRIAYRLTPRFSAPGAMRDALEVRIVSDETGIVVYDGPMVSARVAGQVADARRVLTISVRLPLAAGNDVQGESLTIGWDVNAEAVPAS